MPNPNFPEPQPTSESTESFESILSQYEKTRSTKRDAGRKQLEGTVVALSADSVFFDIGYKTEGILPLANFQGETVNPGDKFPVSVKGRDPEGYYELSRTRVELPKDWSALERAFAEKVTIMGTVTGVIKGGLSVDVGVRAFMPGSRSGARDAAEMEKLVGEEIRCRIIKLDVADENVVVDRRAVAEEEARGAKQQLYSQLKEGDVVSGTVRSLTDFGAFVDLGGVDALLHVSDISLGRINKPADVLTVGQQVEAKVLKITKEKEGEKTKVSIGMKQLQEDPWNSVSAKYRTGERVRGTVTRVMDFGAFVELEPGLEGLIHVSEMSWVKKVKKPSDLVKPGEVVEAVVLGVNLAEKRISLGLKQALGDPWADAGQKFEVGSVVEGPVTSITKFGAFVQLSEGVEGMIHVSEISAEKRIAHPQDVLKVGQTVKAQVLAIDKEKRQFKLSMKQLVPTSIDEYIAEHKAGDVVTGRMTEVADGSARVELGEGIHARCKITSTAVAAPKEAASAEGKANLFSLSSMLQSKWKGQGGGAASKPEPAQAGQIRSFRITKLDSGTKKIELELA